MSDYFKNYSSNAHQIFFEDSLTKGLYDKFESDDLDLHWRSQVCLKLDYFLIAISRTLLSYYIQTWRDGGLMDTIYYAHAHFDGLDLDASYSWSAKAKHQR